MVTTTGATYHHKLTKRTRLWHREIVGISINGKLVNWKHTLIYLRCLSSWQIIESFELWVAYVNTSPNAYALLRRLNHNRRGSVTRAYERYSQCASVPGWEWWQNDGVCRCVSFGIGTALWPISKIQPSRSLLLGWQPKLCQQLNRK